MDRFWPQPPGQMVAPWILGRFGALFRDDPGEVAVTDKRKTGARRILKANLPVKICARCNRPFAWRRKWSRDWEKVKFCSNQCRNG